MQRFVSLLLGASVLALASCGDNPSPTRAAQTDARTPAAILTSVAKWGAASPGKGEVIDQSRMLADNYYLVVDGSGSMGSLQCSSGKDGGRMTDAKDAFRRFVGKLPASDNVGLYVFDNNAWGERVPLGTGSANRAALMGAIDKVVSGYGTPLVPSMKAAMSALSKQAQRQGGYGSYHIVVETDGEPNVGGGLGALAEEVDEITATPVILETIGFCMGTDHPLNRPGKTIYRSATSPEELDRGLDAVIAETDAYTDHTK